uniref:Uncharacterized protein n=1 Tax=Arundo donax TaxID=35708 RepID=A0A0A9BVR7_ARUDO
MAKFRHTDVAYSERGAVAGSGTRPTKCLPAASSSPIGTPRCWARELDAHRFATHPW